MMLSDDRLRSDCGHVLDQEVTLALRQQGVLVMGYNLLEVLPVIGDS